MLPFGVSLLARYDRDPIALKFYGMLLIAIAISRLGIWLYATGRSHILVVPIDRRTRQIGAGLEVVQIVVNGIAIVLADARPTVSLAVYAGIPILYFVAIALIRDTAPAQSAARDFT